MFDCEQLKKCGFKSVTQSSPICDCISQVNVKSCNNLISQTPSSIKILESFGSEAKTLETVSNCQIIRFPPESKILDQKLQNNCPYHSCNWCVCSAPIAK